jgi:heme-degrading monooxygenase HmoA
MSNGDMAHDYISYAIAALRLFFKGSRNLHVSGNLFIHITKRATQNGQFPLMSLSFWASANASNAGLFLAY